MWCFFFFPFPELVCCFSSVKQNDSRCLLCTKKSNGIFRSSITSLSYNWFKPLTGNPSYWFLHDVTDEQQGLEWVRKKPPLYSKLNAFLCKSCAELVKVSCVTLMSVLWGKSFVFVLVRDLRGQPQQIKVTSNWGGLLYEEIYSRWRCQAVKCAVLGPTLCMRKYPILTAKWFKKACFCLKIFILTLYCLYFFSCLLNITILQLRREHWFIFNLRHMIVSETLN